jgi:hypothetical protein
MQLKHLMAQLGEARCDLAAAAATGRRRWQRRGLASARLASHEACARMHATRARLQPRPSKERSGAL